MPTPVVADASVPPVHEGVEGRSAVRDRASHLRIWPVAGAGVAIDLWTKDWAFRTLDWQQPRALVEGWLGLQLSLNPGALFGLGSGFAPVFVGASVLALLFVLYLFVHSTARHRSMHVALGLVLAGAVGNLYDRTMVSAYVWYNPETHERLIGKLLRDDGNAVVIGQFQTGHHPQMRPLSVHTIAGMRPVVRDFIKIEARLGGRFVWPWIFNVADALLVVGVGVLLLNFWFDHRADVRLARAGTG